MAKTCARILFVCLIFIVPITSLKAQNKKFSFGVRAGVNISNGTEETPYLVGNKKGKTGFHVGVNADYLLTKSLYLESGLSLTTKGAVHEDAELWIGSTNPATTYWKRTTNLVYLQLPLKVGYKFGISPSVKVLLNAGGYFAYGIGGKETVKQNTVPSSVRGEEKFTGDSFGTETRRRAVYDLKKEDYGLTFGTGAEYKQFSLHVDFELGLANIGKPNSQNAPGNKSEFRNRNLSVGVGYAF